MKKIFFCIALSTFLTHPDWAQEAGSKLIINNDTGLTLAINADSGSAANFLLEPEKEINDDHPGERREYKTKLGNSAENQVRLIMASSEVKIIGHNSDEVIIETNNYQAPPARAQGLKPLYNGAEDNTGIGLSVKREGNTLTIVKAQKNQGKYVIRVPKKVSVAYTEANWNGGDFELSDVEGEIELKLNNSRAELTNVAGPIVANSTNGGIQVKFKNVNQQKPSSISVVNGEIDISLPAATKANWNLRSINGEVYTDFDMALPKDKTDLQKIAGSNNVKGKTNGGGVEMNVYTINSDIFIRKSK
ncbi:DUF4097 family beta strand repeat-containing protein [Adhaeribacter pallidiroseus]|uniref:DUF4097 domain-containing protein n=1 Tax=Adhaeribacter pallidiroseus TaxID=2072847 RepID=A0A369QGJ6_9BACT|nr:DUF4097 family beta strand repeat-containing protein [Adhaeribacter pallidiroseus]RDC64043.1 hypothetical protein AHMF7616_02653 [Adhaeribacter pallidiroseus]